MKYVVFRVDASVSIGIGHVMRCLTLADALQALGYEAIFICRRLSGNIGTYIESRGFQVEWLQETTESESLDWEQDATGSLAIVKKISNPIAWLIIDHYEIAKIWESILKPWVNKIMVIDDLANRAHLCDLLLDQNLHLDGDNRYLDLVPYHCRLLLGPRYLLLRPSFYESRPLHPNRNGRLEKLLVFFGGSDPTKETMKVLQALKEMETSSIQTTVIIGQSNPDADQIAVFCSGLKNVQLQIQVENMADYIVQSDFALGAGGVAMWERCFLGLPSTVTIVANNQKDSVLAAEQSGAVWNLGWHEQTDPDDYKIILQRALCSPNELMEMSVRSVELFGYSESQFYMPVVEEMMTCEERSAL